MFSTSAVLLVSKIWFFIYLQIRNEKARRYMNNMAKKPRVPFSQKFPNADPLALRLLERLLAFDPRNRCSAEEVRFRNLNTFIR